MKLLKFPWWKMLTTWSLFLVLHYSYRFFPSPLTRILGETAETTYSHMKMLFFAYLFASGIEYLLDQKQITHKGTFLYSRLFIAVIFPWVTISVWFIGEAITGEIFPTLWEIIYANVVTVFGLYLAFRTEEVFAGQSLRPAFKMSVLVLFIAALVGYIGFTLNPPEHFFNPPPLE